MSSNLIFLAKFKNIISNNLNEKTTIYNVYPNIDNLDNINPIGLLYIIENVGSVPTTTNTIIYSKYILTVNDNLDNYVFSWNAEFYINKLINKNNNIYLNSHVNLTTTNKYSSYYSYNVNLNNSSENLIITIKANI